MLPATGEIQGVIIAANCFRLTTAAREQDQVVGAASSVTEPRKFDRGPSRFGALASDRFGGIRW